MQHVKQASLRALNIALVCAAAFAATACLESADIVGPVDQNAVVDPAQAQIWPPVVHTGYNGRDDFLAPVSTNFQVESWEIADPSVASVQRLGCGTPGLYEVAGVIVTKAPGTTTVTAVSGDVRMPVQVVVEAYTVEDTDLGKQRYHEPAPPQDADRLACAACHQAAGGVDHTPLEMAFHDDEALLSVTQLGHYPDHCTDAAGAPCECGSAAECTVSDPGYVLQGDHTWNLTPDEERGIVAYMRSLRPNDL